MGNVHSLGPEESDAYHRDGYLYLPGFFSPPARIDLLGAPGAFNSGGGRGPHFRSPRASR